MLKNAYVEQSLDLRLIASGFPKKEWFLLYIPFGRPLSVDILNAGDVSLLDDFFVYQNR